MITQSMTKLDGNPMAGILDRSTDQGARSIQQKFRPVRPGKVVHHKRWTSFFETFPVGRTDPLSFRPNFPEILVEWISPKAFSRFLAMPEVVLVHTWLR